MDNYSEELERIYRLIPRKGTKTQEDKTQVELEIENIYRLIPRKGTKTSVIRLPYRYKSSYI